LSELALPEQFLGFAVGAERDGATTYAAICRGVAEDPELLALIGEAPVAQRRPNLLLAAVHFLLLGGTVHALGSHYDTVQDHHVAPAGDVVADFKSFCLEHRVPLLELIAQRSTQTNEVGRCAALLPALCAIAAPYRDTEPVALLDLGASAGLNLLFDRYAYTYRQRSDGAMLRAGDATSGVDLECRLRSELSGLPPLQPPPIGARVGLDRSPIDVTSEDGTRWLLACLWPDNLPRFTRLRAALHLARTTADPPVVHQGDIVDDLQRVADTIDRTWPLVVFHSWVAAYLTKERQGQLAEAVRGLSRTRRVHYLYAESPSETPGLPTPPSPVPRPTSDLATALVHVGAGDTPPVRLADMHPHGTWVEWWATPMDPTGRRAEPEPAHPRR
jgi:hypothetical protein